MFDPKFHYTHQVVNSLMAIENSKVIVDMLSLPVDVEKTLRETAKIKMKRK